MIERDLNAVRIGLKGIVTFKGLPNRTFPGVVDYIGSQIERDTRTAKIRMVFSNQNEFPWAGMFGQVTVLVPNTKKTIAFLVPKAALQRIKDGFIVFRQIKPGRYEMVVVSIVAESNEFAEVTGPLKPGDRLVTGDTFILKSQASKDEIGDHDQ